MAIDEEWPQLHYALNLFQQAPVQPEAQGDLAVQSTPIETATRTSIVIPGDEALAAQQTPLSRPNINPYDRDVVLTVPLIFNRRPLGELPVVLTADDRFLVDAPAFLALIGPLLTPDGQAELAARLEGVDSFPSEQLNAAGITLNYDPEQLAVLVIRIDPSRRAVESLFTAGQREPDGIPPKDFSAYLSTNLLLERRSIGGISKPGLLLNGAARYKTFVLEADFQGREDFFDNSYDFDRRYVRLVYDQPEDFRRWYLGDIEPEIRGRQGFVNLGGIGVDRRRSRFDAFRNSVLSNARQIVLQRDSTVRVYRNGILFEEFLLDAGQYDLSQLPLSIGSNNVELEIQDQAGRLERVSYTAYLDPIDLDPGDYEYGAYLGVTSRGAFGSPDYSDGELAFTGFWRKAFFDRPAIGVGLQLSETVQSVFGQTQFILGSGGQLQLDGAVSNSDAGAGFAFAAGYNQLINRGAVSDAFSFVADYTSEDYATLGNFFPQNQISWNFSANYARIFSPRFSITASASYQISRAELFSDSYSLNTTANYRFSPEWSVQFGVEYIDTGSRISNRRDGAGFLVGLVWQPRYDRRADARYSSARNSGSVSYRQSSDGRVGSLGYGISSTYNDGPATISGQADYIANRFDASVAHTSFGRNFGDITDEQLTTLRIGTAIATSGGKVAIGRPIYDSFAILYPHESLGDRQVIVGEDFENGDYSAASGALGPAMTGFLTSYVNQQIRYDVVDVPVGYDIGEGVVRVRPTYRSGYAIEVGSAAFVSALGRLVGSGDRPVALVSGRVTTEGAAEPQLFFTNTVGRFAIQSLEPGKTYRVELFSSPPTEFEFTVPADNTGLLDLETVSVPLDISAE
ncbi:hypothetical protein [Qipengyuania sp. MTN3-11]|uniref:hypothetical protein n=1 Tax=Qipengyuania sp. MTN3-11 TaxID=3056557 RepID=UPI0036F34213